MRKNRAGKEKNGFKMFILDDDRNILDALSANFRTKGYEVETQENPLTALEQLKNGHYDILILDFIMSPICGDEVVARLRKFDNRIYVIMLTGHKELAPPLNTIRELEIQGYCEKSSRYDQLELLVESCVKCIRHINTIYRYQDGLSSILDAIPHLHQMVPVDELCGQVLKELKALVQTGDGFVWVKPDGVLTDPGNAELPADIYRGAGSYDKPFFEFENEDFPVIVEHVRKSMAEQRIIFHNGVLLVPLLGKREIILGVMGAKTGTAPDTTLEALLSVYAEQVSTALHNTLLKMLLNANNKRLSGMNKRLMDSYMQTVEALRLLVDAKDIYTRGHSDRVSYYAVKLAERLEYDAEFVKRVRVAGLLHDIGKIGVSDAVLSKPERLSEEEFREIKKHPGMGANILSCMEMFSNTGEIVCAHHERYDGTGYPRKLKGEEIPPEARIIAIADAFDAMMSDRHYRKKLSFAAAVSQLEEGKGAQFDGHYVDVFLEVLKDYDTINEQLRWTYDENKGRNENYGAEEYL
ncbi:HD domain-containing protein [Eubacterium sp. am_0171]|uniref:Stage 0 sporulation protein A homolog n=1 Tax=Faecalicatena contorta TaxID=39482 RepID=A0A174ANP6_9FIRM|nr:MULTISPECIES: HD domain-containing response regulator [Clostridia]MSC84544.1 HD domain-containing protein [Eubacterium sp. BIOML-A1]MSD06948.1 HD domain-containing protein [Eubacterium sp. BIOML-A2]RYT17147.1 HD domain-containing protein [Eubacterium sp. am_0171]CUN90381.1 Cyclic di-GMP phosphodiesterase response regulator RpfG [[Eubacterium] contortum] [Faecalicatena contorta]